MEAVILFAAGFAPGVFWLWYFYRKDRYEREPTGLILRTAFVGVLAAIPVALLELPFSNFFVAAVIVAPVVEELAKFAVVRWTIYNNPEFNEPMDGVVYAAAAALGFASIENVGYIANQYFDEGVGSASSVFVMRALLSVPGHVLFSSLWGYALGRAKFQEEHRRQRMILLGLSLAMIGHALFNFLLIAGLAYAVVFLLLPYLWKRFNRNVDDLLSGSPFKNTPPPPLSGSSADSHAHEFFAAGSEKRDSSPERQMLPATVQCPACSSQISLTLSERRRGAYICPSCNAFYQAETSAPSQIVEPVYSADAAESVDQAVSDNVPEIVEEETSLQARALPETLLCVSCENEIALSIAERNRGWVVCPTCTFFNAALMPSVLSQLTSDGSRMPRQFKLKPFALCPSCNAELELSSQEREEGMFVCSECGRRTEYDSATGEPAVSQFLMPAEAVCPACEGALTIEEFYRNQVTFECPNCHSTVDYVEDD